MEESPTRSKPLIVLALLMLSLAATALAQTSGNESGTDQTGILSESSELTPDVEAASEKTTADSSGNEGRDLFYYLQVVGISLGALVSAIAIYKFLKHKEYKQKQTHEDGIHVENTKDSAISSGGQSPTIKADRIEGGVHITYPGTKEPTKAEKPLGKISNIPHPHNPNFTGRKDLLEKLHEALASGERAAFTQTSAITGLGGVGKTQFALEYSYRHADDYQVVWWVRSEEPATLAADYAGLAGRLDLPEKSSQDQRVIVEAVKRWLEQNGGWLLVFDNAQDPKYLNDYLPRTGAGRVIITSRNPSWGGIAKLLPVDVFSREESVEFLKNRTGQKGGADALADALGDLPLALEQAGAYILATKVTLADYLELFQTRRNELWKDEKKPDSYREKVETAWTVSMDRIKEEDAVGTDLLNLCAFLAPDDIPRKLFSDGNEHLPESLADKLAVNRAVEALQRYSLISATPESISVHRLVQAVARDRFSEKERKRWAEAAVEVVNSAFPPNSQNYKTWPTCSLLLPHAFTAAKQAEKLEVAPGTTGDLLNSAGVYLGERAGYSEAKSAFEWALKIVKKACGSDDPMVALIIENLGLVLRELGDIEKARKFIEMALDINKKTLPPDHPEIARYAGNLGSVLQILGDLKGAKKCYESAIALKEKAYGSDHSNLAITLGNLGTFLEEIGDFEGAKRSHERALSIYEKTLSSDDPYIAQTLTNIGNIQHRLDNLEDARRSYGRALEIYKKTLPPNHPYVARTISNMGNLFCSQHNLEEAIKCYERALEIYNKTLQPDHLDIARTLSNYALVLLELGNLEAARNYQEKSLEICKKKLPLNHPFLATNLGNLGSILLAQSDLEGAKLNYEQAVDILRKSLGEDHPDTIKVRKNLESLRR